MNVPPPQQRAQQQAHYPVTAITGQAAACVCTHAPPTKDDTSGATAPTVPAIAAAAGGVTPWAGLPPQPCQGNLGTHN